MFIGAHKGGITSDEIQVARDKCLSHAMSLWVYDVKDLLTEFYSQPISHHPFGIRPFVIDDGLFLFLSLKVGVFKFFLQVH